MRRMNFLFLPLLSLFSFLSCINGSSDGKAIASGSDSTSTSISSVPGATVKNGADRLEQLLPLLAGKRVGLIVNQTSVLQNGTHLLDTLLASNITIKRVFAPEHGFRGNADAGEVVKNGRDVRSGLPIVSLYGKQKRPSAEHLADIDVLVFDIQDVGARFYTYISTMLYAMEAASEFDKEFIVLDRPNPNDYVDGPVLKAAQKSFVGALPIPIMHGVTTGELARMICGEKWMKTQGKDCNLQVIPVTGWKHGEPYSLPVKPSPNLPNDQAIRLYPSLCLFEGTEVSVGRGTYEPFQVIGYPDPAFGDYTFTPQPLPGFDKNPLQKGNVCYGVDLRDTTFTEGLSLRFVLAFRDKMKPGVTFITRPAFFDLLAGNTELRKQILSGADEAAIRKTWQPDLNTYREIRKKYLLY